MATHSAQVSGFTFDTSNSAGYLTFTLHAHLPYVVNHGTWPHGMEWLHEAAAETYLPLLRMFGRLEKDGIGLKCNLNLSPILMEQLAHPTFIKEFPRYLSRKIVAAREDEAFFSQGGEAHYAETARFWQRFFSEALMHFEELGGDLLSGFRDFHASELLDIITCGATHGYLPLLGTDESVRAQIRMAVTTHIRHVGEHPKGIWIPECGYRPAGHWDYPVGMANGEQTPAGFERIGVEQAVSESAINFFFVDTHLVEGSAEVCSPYTERRKPVKLHEVEEETQQEMHRSLYQPHFVEGSYGGAQGRNRAATVFARDPKTGVQVWSGERGYPGDEHYLDFHKKRWPGGHRYWRVSGARVDMNDKQPYFPSDAADRIRSHAAHFIALVRTILEPFRNDAAPPILNAPFDAELFGHWWFEGPLWLEAVARLLHESSGGVQLSTCSEYLERHPSEGFITMHEGSWGAGGTNQVWLNPQTSWTYTHIYPAELYTREVCTFGNWRRSTLSGRIVKQLCRELMLLESSDWQFLITTGAARDYAELRFLTHNEQFLELKTLWQAFEASSSLDEHQHLRLVAIEERDSIFPDIDPSWWATDAKAEYVVDALNSN